jgi:predicted nuclease of restriction endonuclease-like (RecB) superfamily
MFITDLGASFYEQERFSSLEELISHLEAECCTLKSDRILLTRQLSVKEEENLRLLKEISSDKEKFKSEEDKVKENYDNFTSTLTLLQQQVDHANECLSLCQTEVVSLKDQKILLLKEISSLLVGKERMQADNEVLAKKLFALNSEFEVVNSSLVERILQCDIEVKLKDQLQLQVLQLTESWNIVETQRVALQEKNLIVSCFNHILYSFIFVESQIRNFTYSSKTASNDLRIKCRKSVEN